MTNELGKYLRKLRDHLDISMRRMAKEIGVTVGCLSNAELTAQGLSDRFIQKIIEVYKLDWEQSVELENAAVSSRKLVRIWFDGLSEEEILDVVAFWRKYRNKALNRKDCPPI